MKRAPPLESARFSPERPGARSERSLDDLPSPLSKPQKRRRRLQRLAAAKALEQQDVSNAVKSDPDKRLDRIEALVQDLHDMWMHQGHSLKIPSCLHGIWCVDAGCALAHPGPRMAFMEDVPDQQLKEDPTPNKVRMDVEDLGLGDLVLHRLESRIVKESDALPCRFFQERRCRFGSDCRFAHFLPTAESTAQEANSLELTGAVAPDVSRLHGAVDDELETTPQCDGDTAMNLWTPPVSPREPEIDEVSPSSTTNADSDNPLCGACGLPCDVFDGDDYEGDVCEKCLKPHHTKCLVSCTVLGNERSFCSQCANMRGDFRSLPPKAWESLHASFPSAASVSDQVEEDVQRNASSSRKPIEPSIDSATLMDRLFDRQNKIIAFLEAADNGRLNKKLSPNLRQRILTKTREIATWLNLPRTILELQDKISEVDASMSNLMKEWT